VERISVAVVRNVPTSRFKESEGEFRELHLDDKTGSHTFEGELSSFEVRSSGTGRSSVLHISTLESRTAEVSSKSAGKRFSIDDSSGHAIKSSRSDVTGESLTTAGQPLSVKTLAETKSMDNFVHDADHLLFMQKDVSGGLDVGSTDDSLADKGSLGASGGVTVGGTSNVVTGSIGFYKENPISVDTALEYGRSGTTADGTGGNLHGSSNGVLDPEGTRNVVQNGRNEVIFDVASDRATGRAQEAVVAVGSHVGVTGEGSTGMVITFRVEVFLNIKEFRF